MLERDRDAIPEIGAFAGLGGLVYAFTHLGVLWRRSDLLDEAATIAERLPELIARDTRSDVVFGAAGCLASLLACTRRPRTPAPWERPGCAASGCSTGRGRWSMESGGKPRPSSPGR